MSHGGQNHRTLANFACLGREAPGTSAAAPKPRRPPSLLTLTASRRRTAGMVQLKMTGMLGALGLTVLCLTNIDKFYRSMDPMIKEMVR